MKPTDAWMPFYIGDYLGDTIHLSKSEHGSYLLSIMHYWRKGEALTREELRAIAGRDLNVVSSFYVWCDNRWHHKRVDEELAKARANFESRRLKALKGVEARLKRPQ